jgi:DNA-directed RNA polymerase subunit F
MVKPQLLSEEALTLAEVKDQLVQIKERTDQLTFRAGKCEEYLNDFVTLDVKDAKKLQKELEGLGISRLRPDHMIHIIDMLPKTLEEAKVIFHASTVSVAKKDMQRIVAVVKEYI